MAAPAPAPTAAPFPLFGSAAAPLPSLAPGSLGGSETSGGLVAPAGGGPLAPPAFGGGAGGFPPLFGGGGALSGAASFTFPPAFGGSAAPVPRLPASSDSGEGGSQQPGGASFSVAGPRKKTSMSSAPPAGGAFASSGATFGGLSFSSGGNAPAATPPDVASGAPAPSARAPAPPPSPAINPAPAPLPSPFSASSWAPATAAPPAAAAPAPHPSSDSRRAAPAVHAPVRVVTAAPTQVPSSDRPQSRVPAASAASSAPAAARLPSTPAFVAAPFPPSAASTPGIPSGQRPRQSSALPDLSGAPRPVADVVEAMRQVVDLLVTGGGAPGALQYLSAAEQRELDDALNALSSPDAAHGVPAVQKLASDALQESKARTASARARLQFAETHCEFEVVPPRAFARYPRPRTLALAQWLLLPRGQVRRCGSAPRLAACTERTLRWTPTLRTSLRAPGADSKRCFIASSSWTSRSRVSPQSVTQKAAAALLPTS